MEDPLVRFTDCVLLAVTHPLLLRDLPLAGEAAQGGVLEEEARVVCRMAEHEYLSVNASSDEEYDFSSSIDA